MLRWLLIGFLCYGIGTGLKDGWMVINWSHFAHNLGFTDIDPEKPMSLQELILDRLNNKKISN